MASEGAEQLPVCGSVIPDVQETEISNFPVLMEGEEFITTTRKCRKMSKELQSIWGEANISFANGNAVRAKALYQEVIRREPTLVQPYQSLAMIFEVEGELDLSFKYALAGAVNCGLSDSDEWLQLANESKSRNMDDLYTQCLRRALSCCPTTQSTTKARIVAELLPKMKLSKSLLTGCFPTMVSVAEKQIADELLDAVAATSARSLTAAKCYLFYFERFSSEMSEERIRHLSDLLIELQLFKYYLFFGNILKVFTLTDSTKNNRFSYYENEISQDENVDLIFNDSVDSLELINIDFMFISLINANQYRSILLQSNDGLLDKWNVLLPVLAKELFGRELVAESIVLYERCMNSDKWRLLPDVMFNFAIALEQSGEMGRAIRLLEETLQIDGGLLEARSLLSELYEKEGRIDESQKILEERSFQSSDLNVQSFIERLRQCSNIRSDDTFHAEAEYLLFGPTAPLTVDVDYLIRATTYKYYQRRRGARQILEYLGADSDAVLLFKLPSSKIRPHSTLILIVFDRLSRYLMLTKQLTRLLRISVMGMLSLPYFDVECMERLQLQALATAFYTPNYTVAYSLINSMIQQNPHSKCFWNVFSYLLRKANDGRYMRFITRLIATHQTATSNYQMLLMDAHIAFAHGQYRHALAAYSYVEQLVEEPDALLSLCIALQYTHFFSNLHRARKTTGFVQALGVMKGYAERRGGAFRQEVYYNYGVLFMHIAIYSKAVEYFNRALLEPPPPDLPHFDLRFECAHNLALIYQLSGSPALALDVMRRHMQIV